MVRALITTAERRRSIVRAVFALTAFMAAGMTAGSSITLSQGTNITVTAPAAFNRIAFDLTGRIWLSGDMHDPAVPLTATGTFNQRPSFSHDGSFVAYESLVSGYRQIFVTDVQSGISRQITFGPFDHITPAWSPADDRLVMSSDRGGTFDLWEVEIGSLELRQLTFTNLNERDPAWNDDGTRLAYIADTGDGSSLFILTPGNKPERILQERQRIVAPAWRPGGGLLTYTRMGQPANQLRMLILSKPPITKPITRHEQVSPRPAHWIDRLDFLYTADGKIRRRELGLANYENIPFSVKIDIERKDRSARDTSLLNHGNRSVLGVKGWTERADGRRVVAALGDLWEFQRSKDGRLTLVRQLTNDAYIDAQPVFSPDGQRLAFISDRRGLAQVWIMEHESGAIRRLTGDSAVTGALAWSPDNQSVAYRVAGSGNNSAGQLRLANVSDGRWQTLSAAAPVFGKPVFADDTWKIETDSVSQGAVQTDAVKPRLPLSWHPASNDQRYIVRAGRIFDGIGPEYLERQEVVIEQGLIAAIRPWSDIEPDTPIIDAASHTLIPGLIDLGTRQEPYDSERFGRKWLAAGITTVRMTIEPNAADFHRAVERLESWSSGRRSGPRMMLAVRLCHDQSGKFDGRLFEHVVESADTLNIVAVEFCPDSAGATLAERIRRAHEHGLSVIATAPVPGMTPGADELRPDVLLSTGNHHPDPVVWGNFLLVSGMGGAVIPSRLVTASNPGKRMLDGLDTSWQYRKIFTAAERARFNRTWRSIRNPLDIRPAADPNQILGNGGSIVLGSEAPLTPQGLGLHSEMRRLAAGGIRPFQILKLAGLDAARHLGYGESLGLIRIGRQADIVILDGDPLAKIDAAANVAGTIVNGRYFSRKDLITAGRRTHSVGNFYNSRRR